MICVHFINKNPYLWQPGWFICMPLLSYFLFLIVPRDYNTTYSMYIDSVVRKKRTAVSTVVVATHRRANSQSNQPY